MDIPDSVLSPEIVTDAIIKATAAILISSIILILKKTGRLSWMYVLSKIETPKQISTYNDNLSKSLIEQTHSWNLQGQQLKDLMFAIHLSFTEADMGNENDRISLEDFILSEFEQSENVPRLVICGSAGSGKSVALGVISQLTRKMTSKNNNHPVLLRFQEIRDTRDEESMIKLIITKLRQHQWEQGKRKISAERFVQDNLFTGKIVLLLDGFDEVSGDQRRGIAAFLCTFFSIYRKIPFIMTSRKAVWDRDKMLFNELKPRLLWMSRLDYLEIKVFLWRWSFPSPKSADLLFQIILEKPYLKTISRNPLMLNIIAYLYANSNRTLPDDKVEFFKECVDSSLGKWDRSQARERESLSTFSRDDKVEALNRIAFANLVEAKNKTLDFLEDDTLRLIDCVDFLHPLTNKEKRELLDDLIINAELLVKTPPNYLQFPHVSLMEYFAAGEAIEKHFEEQILHWYFKDQSSREGLLVMLIGMDLEIELSDKIFDGLIQDYKLTGNPFVFSALSETAVISPRIANQIIRLAQLQLLKKIDSVVVTSLGHLAVNDKRPQYEEVRNVLLGLVESNNAYTDDEFFSLSMAVMDFNVEKVIEWTKKRFKGKIPKEFVKTLSKNAPQKASKILASVELEDLPAFLEGLMEAGEFNVIFDLACNGKSEQEILVAALALSNKFGKFDKGGAIKSTIDKIDYDRIATFNIRQKVEQTYQMYGWPASASRLGPLSEKSRKIFFALCLILADRVTSFGELNGDLHALTMRTVPNEMNYLIGAILHENGIEFQTFDLFGMKTRATSFGLRSLWKYRDWGMGTILLQLLIFVYAPLEMLFCHNPATNGVKGDALSLFFYFLFGWSFLILVAIDIAGLRLPKTIHLLYALFSPYWAFVIHNSKKFKSHWISRSGLPQSIFLIGSAFLHGIIAWPPSGINFAFLLTTATTLLVVIITILSSFLSRCSRLFPNEGIRREISLPSPEIEAEDLQVTMLLTHLMAMFVGVQRKSPNKIS